VQLLATVAATQQSTERPLRTFYAQGDDPTIKSSIRLIREDYFERTFFCRISERVIGLQDVVHRESVSDELAGLQLA
jgi:hypothetical protein